MKSFLVPCFGTFAYGFLLVRLMTITLVEGFFSSLLLQMYLPSEYLWGLINGGPMGEEEDEGDASLPPLMPPYGPKAAANASNED